jgi:hypothetical protein
MQPMYSLCIPKEILVSGRDLQTWWRGCFVFLKNNKLVPALLVVTKIIVSVILLFVGHGLISTLSILFLV